MQVLNTKTFEELKSEATSDLQSVGFSTSPGGIAKLFMNIVNKNIADLYSTLTVNHLRAFVTTADGDALDSIGLLLQCFRLKNESDDNYRYRITQQCLVLATSNEASVRLTALTVDGVTNVIVKPYSMGAGSFTVIVEIDPAFDKDIIISTVYNKLLNVHGYGIRYNVVTPTLTFIKMKHQIILKNSLSDVEKQEIRYDVQLALIEYLNNLTIGQNFMVDDITKIIMNVNSNIIEEINVSLYINNEKAIYVNQSCRWFEKFTASLDTDNVVII